MRLGSCGEAEILQEVFSLCCELIKRFIEVEALEERRDPSKLCGAIAARRWIRSNSSTASITRCITISFLKRL